MGGGPGEKKCLPKFNIRRKEISTKISYQKDYDEKLTQAMRQATCSHVYNVHGVHVVFDKF